MKGKPFPPGTLIEFKGSPGYPSRIVIIAHDDSFVVYEREDSLRSTRFVKEYSSYWRNWDRLRFEVLYTPEKEKQ